MRKLKHGIKISDIVRADLRKIQKMYYKKTNETLSWNDAIKLVIDGYYEMEEEVKQTKVELENVKTEYSSFKELYRLEDGTYYKPPNYS